MRGEVSGIGMGTLRGDTPGKVEVRPHVEEGEQEAEEEGFEEVGRPPMPSPISQLLPDLLQLNTLLCARHLKKTVSNFHLCKCTQFTIFENHLFTHNVEFYVLLHRELSKDD